MVHAAVPASGRLLRRQATYALVAPHVESVHPRLGQAGPSTRCPSSAAPSAPHVRHNTRRRGASASSTATVVQASLQTPEIEVEKTSWSSRRLYARVLIQAPAELVWACLTDYDGLGDFIPSLVENRCLQRKSDGCRLYQVSGGRGRERGRAAEERRARAAAPTPRSPCRAFLPNRGPARLTSSRFMAVSPVPRP